MEFILGLQCACVRAEENMRACACMRVRVRACACVCVLYFLRIYKLLQSSARGQPCHVYLVNVPPEKAGIQGLLAALPRFPLQFLGFGSFVKLGQSPNVYFFFLSHTTESSLMTETLVPVIEVSASKRVSGI